jgi:hypothetical protein
MSKQHHNYQIDDSNKKFKNDLHDNIDNIKDNNNKFYNIHSFDIASKLGV